MINVKSVYIVTGGCSGLGLATADQLLQRGARVVIADIHADKKTPSINLLASQYGSNINLVTTDVTQESSVYHLIAQATQQGELRGVINCAGVVLSARVVGRDTTHSLADFTRTININLIGTFNVLRLAAQAMMALQPDQQGERGVIINTASIAAFDGQIGQSAYAASKGGIVAMTLPIARELAKWGIRVMTIAPGIMETPMMDGMSDEIKASLGSQVPFPARLGKPQEFAHLVTHILDNPYLNGEVIRLDGAIRMSAK